MQPIGNTAFPCGEDFIYHAMHIHRTIGYPEKTPTVYFIYLINGAMRKLWHRARKSVHRISGKMKIC